MFSIGNKTPGVFYAALIDIGSGSVGSAIIEIDPAKATHNVIYEKREWITSGAVESGSDAVLRAIKETLFTVGLDLSNGGVRSLQEHKKGAKISHIQVGVSTPWSYTVSRCVEYSSDEKTTISESLIRELSESAEEQAVESLKEDDIAGVLDLTVVDRSAISVTANGYPISTLKKIETKEITLSHTSSLVRNDVIEIVEELGQKVFPEVPIAYHTFMFMYYNVASISMKGAENTCLIDVTSESTEIGVVRDGILKYVTHVPFGIHTAARAIATEHEIPLPEALTYLKGYSENTITETDTVLARVSSEYQTELSRLFKSSDQSLSLPQALFVHTNERIGSFFAFNLQKVAETISKGSHTTHSITQENIMPAGETQSKYTDTALLISGRFFHKTHTDL